MKKKFEKKDMKYFSHEFFMRFLLPFLFMASFTAIVISPVSCKLTEEGIELVAADTAVPVLESFQTTSEKSMKIFFSERVLLFDLKIFSYSDEQEEEVFYSDISEIEYDSEGKTVSVKFANPTSVGNVYGISGIASDTKYNSLQFSQKFYGFNSNLARLILSEVRVQKSNSNVEFIEMYVLKGGNTFGLGVVSAANEKRNFEFPAIEVETGEYITFHGRSIDGELGIVNELGNVLNLSSASDSCSSARDLWRAGNEKIASQTDVILLKNFANDTVVDALLLCVSSKTAWTKKMEAYAKAAFESGVWSDGWNISDALNSDRMTTVHRTASRQNIAELSSLYSSLDRTEIPAVIKASSGDWLVTEKQGSGKNAISGSTPGYENSSYSGN